MAASNAETSNMSQHVLEPSHVLILILRRHTAIGGKLDCMEDVTAVLLPLKAALILRFTIRAHVLVCVPKRNAPKDKSAIVGPVNAIAPEEQGKLDRNALECK